MSLPTIHRIAHIGQPLGEGVTGVHEGLLRAYLKPLRGNSYIAANELICAELARFLGLPVPASGVAHSGVRGQPAFFASISFNFSEQQLPPIVPSELASKHPDIAAGIVVFDAFVGNLDRHAKNLSYLPKQDTIQLFDHSHALFGHQHGAGVARLNHLRDKLCLNLDKSTDPIYTRHCLGDFIEDASRLLPWFMLIGEMPTSWLRRTIREQGAGLTSEESTSVLDFLIHRRDNLRDIFRSNHHQFIALTQQSLL